MTPGEPPHLPWWLPLVSTVTVILSAAALFFSVARGVVTRTDLSELAAEWRKYEFEPIRARVGALEALAARMDNEDLTRADLAASLENIIKYSTTPLDVRVSKLELSFDRLREDANVIRVTLLESSNWLKYRGEQLEDLSRRLSRIERLVQNRPSPGDDK